MAQSCGVSIPGRDQEVEGRTFRLFAHLCITEVGRALADSQHVHDSTSCLGMYLSSATLKHCCASNSKPFECFRKKLAVLTFRCAQATS